MRIRGWRRRLVAFGKRVRGMKRTGWDETGRDNLRYPWITETASYLSGGREEGRI